MLPNATGRFEILRFFYRFFFIKFFIQKRKYSFRLLISNIGRFQKRPHSPPPFQKVIIMKTILIKGTVYFLGTFSYNFMMFQV